MATADRNSSLELGIEPGLTGSPPLGDAATSGIWLDGEVLACRCPDCGAPMSIRLWLMIADCFRCGASLELSEEQEQEALRLLREKEATQKEERNEAAAAITPTMLPKAPASTVPTKGPPAEPVREKPVKPVPKPPPSEGKRGPAGPPPKAKPVPPPAPARQEPRRRVASTQLRHGTRRRIRELAEKGPIWLFWRDLLRNMPAWLVSLVFHMVALLLLSLLVVGDDANRDTITLSTSVSYEDIEGEVGDLEDSVPDAVEFDEPGMIEIDNDAMAEAFGQPEVKVEDINPVLPAAAREGDLPELNPEVFSVPPAPVGVMFAGRDPKVRSQVVYRAGGTTQTEAAVARGLRWLDRHQMADGSWSLDNWHKAPGAAGRPEGRGNEHNDVAATALALLPFLGAGQTHQQGDYTETVGKGLDWILRHQKPDGDLRGDGGRITKMYAHAQASIALCEAYALTGDENLRGPAQLAINYIVQAQHPAGGWRYNPGEAGDTSVFGWQIMALRSAQMSYLYVPQETFENAARYLDKAQVDHVGGLYTYQPGGKPTPAMTAEGLLCRQYLGWPREHRGLRTGVDFLLGDHLPDKGGPNIYYWYYGTQVMHHMGGSTWERWNERIQASLLAMQRTDGHLAGSWDPRGGHADRGGRIYMTALACCILEVYYRHLPLYGEGAVPAGAGEPSSPSQPASGHTPGLELLEGPPKVRVRE